MAIDFSNICRLCMQDEDSLLPLFEVENGLPAKIEAISTCIKVSCPCVNNAVCIKHWGGIPVLLTKLRKSSPLHLIISATVLPLYQQLGSFRVPPVNLP